MKPIEIVYRFRFGDGTMREFDLELDGETLELRTRPPGPPPEWAELPFRQCGNCPLTQQTHHFCPIAANLSEVVETFGGRVSWERVDVDVQTQGRTHYKGGSLQEGLSSLMGIYAVTSGCPVLDRLRPMVATHVPFMTSEESTYRVISMYLTTQYYVVGRGGSADWKLEGLVGFLEQIRLANQGLTERFLAIGLKDACSNALSTLSARAELTGMAIVEDRMSRWARVFLESVLGENR